MRPDAGDRLAAGRVDQVFLPGFFDDGGSQLDAALGGLWCGNAHCNIVGRDRSSGRSRKSRYIRANGKTFGGEHLQGRISFSPEGETGQATLNHVSLWTLVMEPLNQRFYQWTPVADYDRGLFLLDLPQEATRLIG